MKVLKAYKFRIYPDKAQIQYFIQTFGCVRFTYNHLLHARQVALQKGVAWSNITPAMLKADYPFLKKTDSLALANAQRNLDRAFKNYFSNRAGFPKLKTKKSSWQSYTTNNQKHTIYFQDGQLKLPKLKSLIAVNQHRKIKGTIKSATISAKNNQLFFVSILCLEEIKPLPKTMENIGVSYCPYHLFQLSKPLNWPSLEQKNVQTLLEKANKKLQVRATAAKKRDVRLEKAKNYQKQKVKVEKLRNARNDQCKDYIDQATYSLVRDFDTIYLERRPDFSENKKFCESDWSFFVRKILYKASWYGKQVIFIDLPKGIESNKSDLIEQLGQKQSP